MTLDNEKKIIVRTTVGTIIMNGILAVLKIIAGIFGKSTAMITDAVNSISDVLTNIVVLIFGVLSRKKEDKKHPYGHEKFESMISVFIGMALIITVFEIAKLSVVKLYEFFAFGKDIVPVKPIALVVAVATIVIKETMYHLTRRNAKKARSGALEAIALDNRSDVLATSGALIGIGGSLLGLVYLEPLAALIICAFIIRLAFRIIKSGFSQVVDEAAGREVVKLIEETVNSDPGVIRIDDLKTRQFGMKIFVDIEIAVDHNLSLAQAHIIAHRVHDLVEAKVPDIKHCMVHVNPDRN